MKMIRWNQLSLEENYLSEDDLNRLPMKGRNAGGNLRRRRRRKSWIMIRGNQLSFEEDYLLNDDLNHLLMEEMNVKMKQVLERLLRY